jgi:hypothetical protein
MSIAVQDVIAFAKNADTSFNTSSDRAAIRSLRPGDC